MARWWIMIAGVLGVIGMAAASFSAHGVEQMVETAKALATFKTGVQYHLYHAIALIGVAWLADRQGHWIVTLVGGLWTAGVVLFSGSLYALALTGQKILGLSAMMGGMCLIAGWLLLIAAGWMMRPRVEGERSKKKADEQEQESMA